MTDKTDPPDITDPDAPIPNTAVLEAMLSQITMQMPSAEVGEDLNRMLAAWAANHKLNQGQVLTAIESWLYSTVVAQIGSKDTTRYLTTIFHCLEALANSTGLDEYLELTRQGVPDAEARAAIEGKRH
jgi:hypothetical protein